VTLQLDAEERAMLAGELGPVRKLAIEHQVRVGEFFGARDFVRVTQAHVMADSESLGEAADRHAPMLLLKQGEQGKLGEPALAPLPPIGSRS